MPTADREGLGPTDLSPEELAAIQADDPMHPPRPAPLAIPARGSWYITECESCGWVGSSEQCGDGGGPDHDDIICPVCCLSMAGDAPSDADTAKHGEAVYQRIMKAEAEALAQADTAAQAVAEQATQAARIKFLETEVSEALDRHEAVLSQKHWFEEKLSDALAKVARLSAEVEALRVERDEALAHLPEGLKGASLAGAVQALAFSARSDSDSKWRWGHALTIGLAFADKAAGEEWEHGDMASIDVCYAMAATLKCECDSDEWTEMAKAGIARLAEYRALAAGQDKEGGKP